MGRDELALAARHRVDQNPSSLTNRKLPSPPPPTSATRMRVEHAPVSLGVVRMRTHSARMRRAAKTSTHSRRVSVTYGSWPHQSRRSVPLPIQRGDCESRGRARGDHKARRGERGVGRSRRRGGSPTRCCRGNVTQTADFHVVVLDRSDWRTADRSHSNPCGRPIDRGAGRILGVRAPMAARFPGARGLGRASLLSTRMCPPGKGRRNVMLISPARVSAREGVKNRRLILSVDCTPLNSKGWLVCTPCSCFVTFRSCPHSRPLPSCTPRSFLSCPFGQHVHTHTLYMDKYS